MRCPNCPDVQMRKFIGFRTRKWKFDCHRCGLVLEAARVVGSSPGREFGDGDC